jgi:large subunit ribosomal protein L30e
MSLTDDIQSAIKSDKAIVGYNESIDYIRTSSPKMIIMSNNLPGSRKNEIEHNAQVSKTEIKMFDGTSRELGAVSGKPFPVSTLLIRE